MKINVGAVRGRHEMPVDDYILEEVKDVMDFDKIKRLTFKKVMNMYALQGVREINYYVTGLTQLVLAFLSVMKVFNDKGRKIKYRIYLYDRDYNDYKEFPMDIYINRKGR